MRVCLLALVALVSACDETPKETPKETRTTSAERALRERAAQPREAPAAAPAAAPASGSGAFVPPADFGEGPPSVTLALPGGRTELGGARTSFGVTVLDPTGAPAAGAHVFFFEAGKLAARALADEEGKASLEFETHGGPMSATAILPRVGLATLDLGRPEEFVDTRLRLAANRKASLPRPTACDPGPFKQVMAVLLPGACPGQAPEELALLPFQDSRFEPGIKDYSSPLVQMKRSARGLPWQQSIEWSFVRDTSPVRPRSLRFDESPSTGASQRLKSTLAALEQGLGPPRVDLTKFEGRPHGDEHCGTPVPPSLTASWSFPAPAGLEKVKVSAELSGTAEGEVEKVLAEVKRFTVVLSWPLPR